MPFRDRMERACAEKKSAIVLALDPAPADIAVAGASSSTKNLKDFAERMVGLTQEHVCAIKMNFHLLLPLAAEEVSEINKLAHSFGLQSIADIKLNDIESTNQVALDNLVSRMGFDAVIANPFMGQKELASLVRQAHKTNAGVIALVYMSHPGAAQGYGLQVVAHRRGEGRLSSNRQMYEVFHDRAAAAGADGIVVGATQAAVLRQIRSAANGVKEKRLPIYSPGVGTQGGDALKAVKNGSDYLIVGRSITRARDPAAAAKAIQAKISKARQ